MKKITTTIAAVALAVSGLVTAVALPAGAAAKKTTCYTLGTSGIVKKTVTSAGCPTGYSKTKPSLQGTGFAGDPDLVTPSAVQLNINGSSFDAPLVGATTTGQTAYPNKNVSFSSYPAAGSGAGRTGITNGSLDIGFSDQPMTPTAGTLPSGATESNYVQVPYLLGGAVVAYNIPNLDYVKLTSKEIAEIYDGKITQWSDPQIVSTNGGPSSAIGSVLAGLTAQSYDTIKVLYRSASSGTTYAFTDFLNAAGGSGHTPSGTPMEGGGGWGAVNVKGEANNAAMATDLNSIPGSIGYVEYSYVLIPGNAKIQIASLQDANNQWLTPSLANIAAAATAAGTQITPDNFSIVDQKGNNVWPLATYSWAIVAKSQTNEAKGEAIVKYLDWETHAGQALANGQGYIALPAAVAAYARQQLAQVTSNGTELLTQKA